MVKDDIEAIIAQLDQGNRDAALRINAEFWQNGYELSLEDELDYIDCLLDMGELESAEQMLQTKMQNLGDYGADYYEVLLKYGFLSGNLNILNDLSEYEEVYEKEPLLFDWIRERYQNYSLRDYAFMLQKVFAGVRNLLCMTEVGITENGEATVIYYTNRDAENNNAVIASLNEQVVPYFTEKEKGIPDDLIIDIESIMGS